MTLLLGILAGVIQALGYALYIKSAQKNNSDPNPVTWLIFSVDVFVFTILEAGAGALIADLIVPVVCGLGALTVAVLLLRKGKLVWWPQDKNDRIVLVIAGVIIAGYLPTWFLSEFGNVISKETRHQAAVWFLVLSNLNTVVGFWPTLKNPEHEHPGSWLVWTIPYMLLLVILVMRAESQAILYAYPISGVFFHGLVGVLALKPFIKRMKAFFPERRKTDWKWDAILFRIFF